MGGRRALEPRLSHRWILLRVPRENRWPSAGLIHQWSKLVSMNPSMRGRTFPSGRRATGRLAVPTNRRPFVVVRDRRWSPLFRSLYLLVRAHTSYMCTCCRALVLPSSHCRQPVTCSKIFFFYFFWSIDDPHIYPRPRIR